MHNMEKLADYISKWKISSRFHDSTSMLAVYWRTHHSVFSCRSYLPAPSIFYNSCLLLHEFHCPNCVFYNKPLFKESSLIFAQTVWDRERKLCPEPLLTVKSAAEDCSKLSGNFLIDSFLSLSLFWLIVCAGCDPAISKSSNPQQCLLAGSGGSTAAH